MIVTGVAAQLPVAIGSPEFWAAFWPSFLSDVASWAITVGIPAAITWLIFRKKLKAAFRWTGALIAKVWRAVWSVRLTTTARQAASQSIAFTQGKAAGLEEGRADGDARVEAAVRAVEKQLAQTRSSLSDEGKDENFKLRLGQARDQALHEGYERGLKDGARASAPLSAGPESADGARPATPQARFKISVESGQDRAALMVGPVRFVIENLVFGSVAQSVRLETAADFQFDDGGYWQVFGQRQKFSGTVHDGSSISGLEFIVRWVDLDGKEKEQRYKTRPWLRHPFSGLGPRLVE